MNFDAMISVHIKTVKNQLSQLLRERDRLLHTCDCEYCEYDGVNDENQRQYDELTADIDDCAKLIHKLADWARFKGIDI